MTTQIEKDYAKWNLRSILWREQARRNWGGIFTRIEEHFQDIFRAGYEAGVASKEPVRESPIDIDQMPEDWKDGREVWIHSKYQGWVKCLWGRPLHAKVWGWGVRGELGGAFVFGEDDTVTHAMLPPSIGISDK